MVGRLRLPFGYCSVCCVVRLRLFVNPRLASGLQQSFAIVVALDLLLEAQNLSLEIVDHFVDLLDCVNLFSGLLEETLLSVMCPPFSIAVLAVLAELPAPGGRLFVFA